MNYATWHEIEDETKLAQLVESMSANGWVGTPLVADNDQLLTGAHRWVAAEQAGIEAAVVDIRDICAEHGIDWDALLGEYDYAYEIAVVEIVTHELPQSLKNEYGIDLH